MAIWVKNGDQKGQFFWVQRCVYAPPKPRRIDGSLSHPRTPASKSGCGLSSRRHLEKKAPDSIIRRQYGCTVCQNPYDSWSDWEKMWKSAKARFHKVFSQCKPPNWKCIPISHCCSPLLWGQAVGLGGTVSDQQFFGAALGWEFVFVLSKYLTFASHLHRMWKHLLLRLCWWLNDASDVFVVRLPRQCNEIRLPGTRTKVRALPLWIFIRTIFRLTGSG